jgi:hypothetical protein
VREVNHVTISYDTTAVSENLYYDRATGFPIESHSEFNNTDWIAVIDIKLIDTNVWKVSETSSISPSPSHSPSPTQSTSPSAYPTQQPTQSPDIVNIWGNNIVLYMIAIVVIAVVVLLVLFLLRRR